MWNSALKTSEDFEQRIRDLASQYQQGGSSESLLDEIEVLATARYIDPESDTRRGRMRLSEALSSFSNTTPSEFKKAFDVPDLARDFDAAYNLVREVAGRRAGLAIMGAVLTETGDVTTASVLALDRLVSPAANHRREVITGAAAQ